MAKKINVKIEKVQPKPQRLRVGGCWSLIERMNDNHERWAQICERYFSNGI